MVSLLAIKLICFKAKAIKTARRADAKTEILEWWIKY